MSTNGEKPEDVGSKISDEEGLVDRKTKEHILNLRVQIDEDERELFVNQATDPERRMGMAEATQFWSVSVKQYLRAIKRLWNDDDNSNSPVKNVDLYWRRKKLAEYTLVPPDKNGYQFSLIAQPDVDATTLRRTQGLPRDAEVPRPETKDFYGLQSILDTDVISHNWVVYIDKKGAPPNWEQIPLSRQVPLPKGVLEDAVEMADNFLQQAGVGFKVGDDLPDWGSDIVEKAKERDDIEVI